MFAYIYARVVPKTVYVRHIIDSVNEDSSARLVETPRAGVLFLRARGTAAGKRKSPPRDFSEVFRVVFFSSRSDAHVTVTGDDGSFSDDARNPCAFAHNPGKPRHALRAAIKSESRCEKIRPTT